MSAPKCFDKPGLLLGLSTNIESKSLGSYILQLINYVGARLADRSKSISISFKQNDASDTRRQ
jgi:hypothetical protein